MAPIELDDGPLGRPEVLALVRERLAEILEIEPSGISEGASFADDLDADSLALIELVEALEADLSTRSAGFRIEDEDLEDLKTVRDAVDYVVSRVGSPAGSPASSPAGSPADVGRAAPDGEAAPS